MRRLLTYLGAPLVSCALVGIFISPAQAANGQIVIFVADYQDVAVFDNPSGCELLPVGSHVLVNLTDEQVTFYQDPLCVTDGPGIDPGQGAHVPAFAGSFKVS